MPCHNVNFIAFDFTRQHDRGWLRHDPFTPLSRPVVSAVFIQIQFPSDLPVRQIQAQEIQTQQPDSQRLMVAREEGVREVIEVPPAAAAVVALSIGLSLVQAPLHHLRRVAMRTVHAVGPTQLSDHFKALLIVDQRSEGQFHPWLLATNLRRDSHGSPPCSPLVFCLHLNSYNRPPWNAG